MINFVILMGYLCNDLAYPKISLPSYISEI